jgi:beta-glucosidase
VDDLRYAAGYDPQAATIDPALIDEAQRVAEGAEVAVVFAGLPGVYETEGVDRQHMAMPHDALIEAVARVNPNVVVVLMNGAPVEMPWHREVPAILEAYLGGQAGGSAVAQLLYGEVNPSGKLAETFPFHLEDHPAYAFFPGGPRRVAYRESIYVGYRYYDTARKAVLFPFGHGLSYTTFSYSDVCVSVPRIRGEEGLDVAVTITNTGTRAGQEVVQLYVRDVESTVFRPLQELKAFAKVHLDPGASETVTFTLDRRSFAYWDAELHDWYVEPGEFEIRVGASSRDIRGRATVEVVPETPRVPRADRGERLDAYYDPAEHTTFGEEAFATLYGRPLPPNRPERPGTYTWNTPLGDIRGSLTAFLLRKVVLRQAEAAFADDPDNPMARHYETILAETPLRQLVMFTGGGITLDVLDGLVQLVNGKLLRGIWTLLQAMRNRDSSREG